MFANPITGTQNEADGIATSGAPFVNSDLLKEMFGKKDTALAKFQSFVDEAKRMMRLRQMLQRGGQGSVAPPSRPNKPRERSQVSVRGDTQASATEQEFQAKNKNHDEDPGNVTVSRSKESEVRLPLANGPPGIANHKRAALSTSTREIRENHQTKRHKPSQNLKNNLELVDEWSDKEIIYNRQSMKYMWPSTKETLIEFMRLGDLHE